MVATDRQTDRHIESVHAVELLRLLFKHTKVRFSVLRVDNFSAKLNQQMRVVTLRNVVLLQKVLNS